MLYPVYNGTYERGDGMESDNANMSSTWCDDVIMWGEGRLASHRLCRDEWTL